MRVLSRTVAADQDLIDIWTYLAQENLTAADRLLDSFQNRFEQLLVYPESGQRRDDIAAGLRHLTLGNHLILYRYSDGTVTILRVLHGRRKIGSETIE
ncbi:plasmid stabilization protein [Pararhizobium polonicum]|uniref:Plasmid stabilization protein n=1 Tax=Pararhizobium polonicum TaxID=1612624 RepID=A0A1C7NXN3_9HYPH|nr:type II toxin-antitoxin system RelE/ParE family toxin [Pararhizobium polonicum]OBZ93770.1 plasmid stabilization protein [Pararhizobium polonicum]